MPKDIIDVKDQGEVIIYQAEDGSAKIDVRFIDDTVWLTQQQLAKLFKSSRTNILEHIKHIYEEEELDKQSTCRNFRQVRTEGARQIVRDIPYYNSAGCNFYSSVTLPFPPFGR